MPTQLFEHGPRQIPHSGELGFLSEGTSSLLPDQPGGLGLESNRRNPVDIRRLESHGSVPLAFPGHVLSSSGEMPLPDLCLQDRQVRQGSSGPWQQGAKHVPTGSAGGTGVCRVETPAAGGGPIQGGFLQQ